MRKLQENIDNKRKCSICGEIKELNIENFHKDKSRYLGFMYNCRLCEKERTKKKYLNNPRTGRYGTFTVDQKNKIRNISKIYSKTNTGRAVFMASVYRSIDKRKGYENNVTKDFILNEIFTKPCCYCGDTEKIGCDRIDNSIGHLISNVVPCCSDCNIARMDNFTHEEMKIIGLAIKTVKQSRI